LGSNGFIYPGHFPVFSFKNWVRFEKRPFLGVRVVEKGQPEAEREFNVRQMNDSIATKRSQMAD